MLIEGELFSAIEHPESCMCRVCVAEMASNQSYTNRLMTLWYVNFLRKARGLEAYVEPSTIDDAKQ